MSDNEIKDYIALYFQFDTEQEYDNVCNQIKETGVSESEVKFGLLKYINNRIKSNKIMYDNATGDFASNIKLAASRNIIQLDDLRKSLK